LAALPEAQVAELWLEEAQRRDAEMESGQVAGIPGEEVFRRLYDLYGALRSPGFFPGKEAVRDEVGRALGERAGG